MVKRLRDHLQKMGIEESFLLKAFEEGNAGHTFYPETGQIEWTLYDIPVMRLTLSFPYLEMAFFAAELGELQDDTVEQAYEQWK